MHIVSAHVAQLGLTIAYAALPHGRHAQLYEDGSIVVNVGDPIYLQRIALAHECGHWHYGHTHTDRDTGIERLADEYAAKLLIPTSDYIAAEHETGGGVYEMARLLRVTTRIIYAWRRAYHAGRIPRAHTVTYTTAA